MALTDSTVYMATLEINEEESTETLVSFGGITEDAHYDDGAAAESHFTFNRALWEKVGKPEKLTVAFSAEEFRCISVHVYEDLRERLVGPRA